jgi:segregation and condensation protein B
VSVARQANAGRVGRADRQRRRSDDALLDTELADLPPDLRWREWMQRVEAIIFASATPVPRETLAGVVGRNCSIDLLIDDLREELRGRPYELVSIAGGWQHRTKPAYAGVIRASAAPTRATADLSADEAAVLMAIGYFQPVTRSELSKIFGKEISRDLIGNLRSSGLIASGPRSPQPGAPYTYVTTQAFLSAFGFDTLRDLPDIEMLEDAGLLSRDRMMVADIGTTLSEESGEE